MNVLRQEEKVKNKNRIKGDKKESIKERESCYILKVKQKGSIFMSKNIGGICFSESTAEEVCKVLLGLRSTRKRVRLFYGDVATGKCWNDLYGTMGYLGKSTGKQPILILLNNRSSVGGTAVLDSAIVRITVDKQVVYTNPNFHIGHIQIKQEKRDSVLLWRVVEKVEDRIVEHYVHEDKQKCVEFVAFLRGERNK